MRSAHRSDVEERCAVRLSPSPSGRSVSDSAFAGAEADKLVTTFLVPAAEMLASSFSQPIVLGDLRGALKPYPAFAERVVAALPEVARRRLAWTTHVYVETTNPPPSASEAKALVESGTRKLDLDLEVARKLRVPLLVYDPVHRFTPHAVPGLVRDFCLQGLAAVQLGAARNDRFFCSQFVLEAFRQAQLALTAADPLLFSPADLLTMREGDVPSVSITQALQYVGHLKLGPGAEGTAIARRESD